MRNYVINIEYRDGSKDRKYVEDYGIKNNCLCMTNRFGENAGTTYIPLDRIKEFKVE